MVTPPCFLLPLKIEFLSFYLLSLSHISSGWLLIISLLFSQRWCYSSGLWYKVLLTLSKAFKLFFFVVAQQSSRISLQETWTSTKALSSVSVCARCPWLRGVKANSQVSASSTAHTEVFLPIPQFTGGWDSSRDPWHMVLDLTISTEALLFMNKWMLNFRCLKGEQKGGTSYGVMMLTSILHFPDASCQRWDNGP